MLDFFLPNLLDIIIQMGFPGYFLIVMDFIQWAKDHDIPLAREAAKYLAIIDGK